MKFSTASSANLRLHAKYIRSEWHGMNSSPIVCYLSCFFGALLSGRVHWLSRNVMKGKPCVLIGPVVVYAPVSNSQLACFTKRVR